MLILVGVVLSLGAGRPGYSPIDHSGCGCVAGQLDPVVSITDSVQQPGS